MNLIADIEYDLMSYCLKHKGKWWANHLFRNKEVNVLYDRLRSQSFGTVIAILDKSIIISNHKFSKLIFRTPLFKICRRSKPLDS